MFYRCVSALFRLFLFFFFSALLCSAALLFLLSCSVTFLFFPASCSSFFASSSGVAGYRLIPFILIPSHPASLASLSLSLSLLITPLRIHSFHSPFLFFSLFLNELVHSLFIRSFIHSMTFFSLSLSKQRKSTHHSHSKSVWLVWSASLILSVSFCGVLFRA